MQRKTWLLAAMVAGLVAAGWALPARAGELPRAFLGVFVSGDRSDEGAGVRVDRVLEESGADRARIQGGDVLLSFDGSPLQDLEDLFHRLESRSPGDRDQLEVLREGERQTFDVTLGERPDEGLLGGRPKLGVQIVGTTPELREHLGGDRDRGALVGKVLPGFPAQSAGVAVGDLITAVNGERVENAASLWNMLANRKGETVDLEVVRDHRTVHLQVALP